MPPLRFSVRDTQMHTNPISCKVCLDAHVSADWALGCHGTERSPTLWLLMERLTVAPLEMVHWNVSEVSGVRLQLISQPSPAFPTPLSMLRLSVQAIYCQVVSISHQFDVQLLEGVLVYVSVDWEMDCCYVWIIIYSWMKLSQNTLLCCFGNKS